MPKLFAVCDLDGTLFNVKHREQFAREGKWEDFHAQLVNDTVYEDVKTVVNALQVAGISVIGLTGRPEKWRKLTIDQMFKNDVNLDMLLMRPDNDFTPDKALKPAMLANVFEDEQDALNNVLMIMEDRDRVVEEWRNRGYQCWHVRSGGY